MHTLVLGDFLWAARRRINQKNTNNDDDGHDDDSNDERDDDDEGDGQVTRVTDAPSLLHHLILSSLNHTRNTHLTSPLTQ